MIVPYAEVQSPTVTPLPEKPQVFLMTLNEIGRLGPKRSKVDKKIRLGKLRRDPATQDEKFKKYSITVRKCPDSALGHLEKILVLMLDSQGASHRDLKLTVTDLAVEVSFGAHAKFHLVDDCVKKAMELCRNLFANLHAFSLAEFLADFASDLHYARAVLSRRPWNFPSDPDWGGFRSRLSCISELLQKGHCEAAFTMIADLSSVCGGYRKSKELTSRERSICPFVFHPDDTRLQFFVQTLAADDTRLTGERRYAVQAGKMVLHELLATPNDLSELLARHIKVFKAVASHCKDPTDCKAVIRELLDLPRAARGALLQNPKARALLLLEFPELEAVFAGIEQNAIDVFVDRLRRLEIKGFTFPSNDWLGEQPIAIVEDRPVDADAIDLLLDLAEAAVNCTGLISWATGVLSFISEWVPLDDQLDRAKALRDLVQRAVRFHPDKQMAGTFQAARDLTNDAIDQLDT